MTEPRASAPKREILVVEDSQTQAEALRFLLDDAGFAVRVARSGEEALADLLHGDAGMVISDIIMPGITGFELCSALRIDARFREIPFILLTSLADPLDVVRGLECGADNYVTKPYEPRALLARVARTFESHAARGSRTGTGPIEITFLGARFSIAAGREQILDVLLSSFEDIARANLELRTAEQQRETLYVQERRARVDAEEARRQAVEANRVKSEFLAMMSHDLRTPLNAIGGYAELLAMGIRGPVNEAQAEDLERIRRSQRHLLQLVNDILGFARLESGEIPLDLQPVPLDSTIRNLHAVIVPQAAQKDITYEYLGCDGEPRILADRERLEQILINLLGNAVKFTGEGGRVTMRCFAAESFGTVEVSDTGVGIPAEQLQQIFDPFVQVEPNFGKREGVGLGLAICHKLADAMGGEISVRSKVGVGSTFSLSLPLAKTVGQ